MDSKLSMEGKRLSNSNHHPSIVNPNLFADSLFKVRAETDVQTQSIIEVSRENKCLRQEINTYKESLPPLLLKWWESNRGVEQISQFLNKLRESVEGEIQVISRSNSQSRGEFQVLQADFEEEMRTKEETAEQMERLEGKLATLEEKNGRQKRELDLFRQALPQLSLQIFKDKEYLLQLKPELDEIKHGQNFLDSYFKDRPFESKEQQFREHQEWMIRHVLGRKKVLRSRLKDLNTRRNYFRNQIKEHEREDKEKEGLMRDVSTLQEKVSLLEREVRAVREERMCAEKRQKELEDKLYPVMMERAIKEYSCLLERFKQLALRCNSMVRQSIESSYLEEVQRMVQRE